MRKRVFAELLFCSIAISSAAQKMLWVSSTDDQFWQQQTVRLSATACQQPALEVNGSEDGTVFKAWGTCFNELDWDALNMLTREQQEEVMRNIFSPTGELKFTRGRLSMNANDYSRSWYSCDEVAGDFQLRYFNIERDKRNVIPLVRAAQRYNPDLTFWVSPWCPPSWMKINGDYPVRSSKYNQLDPKKDYMLYEGALDTDPNEVMLAGQQQGKFPKRLAVNNYMIQDPRYLQAYANMFCRFIQLYQEQGVPIDMVMYQNEAYSYTPYPGCAWTAEGTVRFNKDYLAPTLKEQHPDVSLYLGTFNTNRLDYVEHIVSQLQDCVTGLGFQWEGRDNLVDIHNQYPQLRLVSSESECGNGSMDWKAGEHTFFLLADYLGKGCEEYFIWNFILADQGESPWGWKQNALVQVDSKTRLHRYTAEYYAVRHFSGFVSPGSCMIGYQAREESEGKPVVIFKTPKDKYVVMMGNFTDSTLSQTVRLGTRFLNAKLPPHSFNTFVDQ